MKREEVLREAKRIITTDRNNAYGEPEDNFSTIAALWETYIKTRCVGVVSGVAIFAEDVAVLMALLKIARIASGREHSDNWIDAIGYMACGGEIAGEETR